MQKKFTAIIQQHEGINGAYIEIPFDVNEVFGAKRVKVLATFDEVPYRGSIVRMNDCYMIGIPQAIRKKIVKDFGASIVVTIEKDEEERIVEIPDEFQALLDKEPKAKETYAQLSFTGKKEYIRWITEAKKQETRINRMEKAISLLIEGKKLR